MPSPFEQARETRRLAGALDGFARLALLRTGLRLGLFDALREPCTAAELADRLALAPDLVAAWAAVLHADGLLRERHGAYGLGAALEWMLEPSRKAALAELIDHLAEHAAARLLELPELMKGAARPAADVHEEGRVAAAVSSLLEARTARALLRIPPARHARRIAHLGCGRGALLALLVGRRRDATGVGTELDLALRAHAERRLDAAGLGRRAQIRNVDPTGFEPPPADLDLIVVGHALRWVPPDAVEPLFARLARLLVPGGALVVEMATAGSGRMAELLGLRAVVLLHDLVLRAHRNLYGLPAPELVRRALDAAGLEGPREEAVLPGGAFSLYWAARPAS